MFFGCKIAIIVFVADLMRVAGEVPNFRVLAPEFVCPNDEEAVIDKPDNTVISVKTDARDLHLSWIVRWTHLDNPSQRFTLLLWRTVRDLEAKLNGPQPEPFVYIIDNAELLKGVEYIFNVTGSLSSDPGPERMVTKTFLIDNIKGDKKLMIEGRSDKFSVLLIGGETVYADMEYVLEAQVTTCHPVEDYYFTWIVQSTSASSLNVSDVRGGRLEIPRYSLQAGAGYYVSCSVYWNTGEFVTQTGLPFQVLYRGLAVDLNLDALVVTANNAFEVRAVVTNHDYYEEVPKFQWSCFHENETCENVHSVDTEILAFSRGLTNLGRYEIILELTIQDQYASANATIYVVEPTLPVIQIQPLPRVVNEHSLITLTANASNVTPSCVLTWYFTDKNQALDYNNSCDECQHGQALPGSVSITSLEESFLNELTDFTNETEWRQVTTEMKASSGRARFVAQCGCSLTFSCETQGLVHGDVNFEMNEGPIVSNLKVSPETGSAMETVFRLSTLAASDSDKPLRYTFYCSLGNDTLVLGSHLEHLAIETFLPYIDTTGTNTWVEVCDSLGACTSSEVVAVRLLAGEGRTVDALVDSVRGHVARCEVEMLKRVVKSTITTYKNTNNEDIMTKFIEALLEILTKLEDHHCIKKTPHFYQLVDWLNQSEVDISNNHETL